VSVFSKLAGRHSVVLDTMVWVYFFEAHELYGELCKQLLLQVEAGSFSAALTPITLAELIVKPLRQGRQDRATQYRSAMQAMINVQLLAFSVHDGWLAGSLCAKYALRLPDAMQVAAALAAEQPTLVTNDKALARVKEVHVVLLSDLLRTVESGEPKHVDFR